MSSETAVSVATMPVAPPALAPMPVADAYAFEQLEATAAGPVSAQDLLSAALVDAERIRAEARQAAEREGREVGIATGREEVHAAVRALATALASIAEARCELIAGLERDAADLALQLAEQVIAGVLDVQPECVIDVARNALRRVTDRQRVTLVVNPADLEIVSDSVSVLQSELGGIGHCEVQADRRVGRGGALLRTSAGEVDVTIASQLARAREIVAQTLAAAHEIDADGQ